MYAFTPDQPLCLAYENFYLAISYNFYGFICNGVVSRFNFKRYNLNMSKPQSPRPAKLIISLLMKEKGTLLSLAKDLEKLFGPFDIVSAWLPFEYTSYYEPEMGGPLFRRLVVFKKLIKQNPMGF